MVYTCAYMTGSILNSPSNCRRQESPLWWLKLGFCRTDLGLSSCSLAVY